MGAAVALGFLLATSTFLLLTATMDDAAFFAWGWRLPFLGSAVLVGTGLWIRWSLSETPKRLWTVSALVVSLTKTKVTSKVACTLAPAAIVPALQKKEQLSAGSLECALTEPTPVAVEEAPSQPNSTLVAASGPVLVIVSS